MIQVTHQTYDIQRVREVRPCDDGMQVVFLTGLSVCVRKEHPEYERLLHQARSSLQYAVPVGIMVSDAGALVELNYTHQSAVRHVRPDEEDPSRLMVEFWTYSHPSTASRAAFAAAYNPWIAGQHPKYFQP